MRDFAIPDATSEFVRIGPTSSTLTIRGHEAGSSPTKRVNPVVFHWISAVLRQAEHVTIRIPQHLSLRAPGVVVLAASVLVISACGSSTSDNGEAKKKGPQVSKDAAAALKAAGSAHFKGTETDGSTTATIDLQLIPDAGIGTITQSGTTINLINSGGSSYVKAPAAFYTAQGASAANAATVADKWVKLPATETSFAEFTLNALSADLAKPSSGSTIEDAVTTGKFDNQSVVILKQTDGSQLFIAADGPAYAQAGLCGHRKSTSTFTDFGKKVTIQLPPAP